MRPVQKEVLAHDGAPHKLIFEFIGEHPFGKQQTFVSSAPVESVETVGFAFELIEPWLWRTNQHRDALNDWANSQTYFVGKDLEISRPWCERWRQVHRSA